MQPLHFEQTSMDTRVTITLYSDGSGKNEESVEKAFMVFRDLEKQFSLFKVDSEISLVNSKAGEITPVSPLFLDVLDYALGFAEKSKGAFNPLVGAFTPGVQLKNANADLTAFGQIKIDKNKSMVLLPKDAALDLNSVIKGLAIDLAMDCFEQAAVMIEAGGDIKVKGTPPNKKNWDIGIRDPKNPTKLITVVHLKDAAICTSGNYFREEKLATEGRLHLVNTISNQAAPRANTANSSPANSADQQKTANLKNGLSSVTVIAPTAKLADVLSTAIFFMPVESAILFIEKFEGASCLLIDNRNEIYMSPKMRVYFQP